GALDDLAELGVNLLWMSPLFAAPGGDFGYAVVDYFRVRSDYGTADDLRQLVSLAHQRGMRVVLDLPANHTSREHRYFRQAQALGKRSHYYGFYARDGAGQPTHYFDWDHLPNLEYGEPEVVRFMLEAARHWVAEAEVDGYRVDAAWGVRQRNPEYWPRMREVLGALDPDVLLLAEASARDAYYLEHGFDLTYDWTAELGHHAWEHVFDAESGIARRLNEAVLATAERTRVLRFLNNNDTGKRFVTRHGLPLTRVATAALLTLPGVPCLYSKDEIGAEFEPYEALPQRPPAHPELRAFHRRLIEARRTRPALASPDFQVLHAGSNDEVYAYLRGRGPEVLLVVLNFSAQRAFVRLELPQDAWPSEAARDAESGERVKRSGAALELAVPGWAARIYEAN
ncbi:MAG TPA: alpha-amylase family glycosyl hydrolase, partial [Polyangiales bacterium]|nr:alpha-amylase family glycosyl hydrolase [Polyangiales bacterium]